MIKNRVYKLKKTVEVGRGLTLQAGQEIEIVMNVVYMGGFMLPPEMQPLFLEWIKNNPALFEDDTRNW